MKFRHILTAGAAIMMLAGCATYGAEVGVYGPTADVEYDGYYDGYYGPVYDGYWGDGGVFYYRTSDQDHWRRGDATHFRRDEASGFNHIHGTAHAGKARAAKPDRAPE